MAILRRSLHIVTTTALIFSLAFLHNLSLYRPRRAGPNTGKDEAISTNKLTDLPFNGDYPVPEIDGKPIPLLRSSFTESGRGKQKAAGSKYTQVLVISRLENDNISWIQDELPGIETAVYVANDPTSTLHPPKNKGHEVIIYLTYLIDHYSSLPDTIIFMHAHRWTHHNIELLGHDSAEMVRRLSNDYVAHKGYVNMRCQWSPGCLEWLHPDDTRETLAKQEEVVLSRCWHEMFPLEPIPKALGQGCCAQFAVSKDRVLSIPLSRFVFYRDWILRTPLSDYISGRIWEYLWQFLFTGKGIYCPSEHACHCQGFGICFGSDAKYKEFERLRRIQEAYKVELNVLREERLIREEAEADHSLLSKEVLSAGRYLNLSNRIEALERDIMGIKQRAIGQGRQM